MYKTQGNKTRRILNLIKHKTQTAREIFEAIIPVSPDTYKVTKRLLGYMDTPKFNYQIWKRLEEKRFYTLLAKLRKEGLIKKQSLGMNIMWQLTVKGIKKLIHYTTHKQKFSILPKRIYEKKKIDDKILIIFDIPEKRRNRRAWLRFQLKTLGFAKLQQSVWIGTYAVPTDFIHDLKEANLLKYIHIFKISKTGSMIE